MVGYPGPYAEASEAILLHAQGRTCPAKLEKRSLEAIVTAISDGGDTDLADKLRERYLDFSPLFDLIDEWDPENSKFG